MAQNDIGIDLGTTTIIIAQEGKGVVGSEMCIRDRSMIMRPSGWVMSMPWWRLWWPLVPVRCT